ncbi:MAG: hypothetical protein ABIP30_04240 [Ferruginibacter sp.]
MKSKFYGTGRTVFFFSILFLFANATFAQQTLEKIDGWNAYVHLPDDYNDGTGKVYPLICFVPGTGEVGTDASRLLVNGPSKFVAAGNKMQFTVNGKLEKPIVISLQPVSVWPNAYTLNVKLDSIVKRYRCDLQRINVTGLSMGGWSWDNFVDNYNPTYTNRITSIVSMSAPPPDNTVTNMKYYTINGGTAWFFEGNQDLRGNDQIRDTMNKYVSGSARYTLYAGGHCCWNTFYDPSWTENGESIYTWMLKQKKDLIKGALPPQADAGNDSTLAAPLVNLSLKGYGNDPNGLPIIFNWKQVAGPSAGTINNPASLQTNVSSLIVGTYKFQLTVSNSLGLIAQDTIVVNNGILGPLPVTLTAFSAKIINKQNVLIQWKTTTEINADYFIVEKKNNNFSFEEVSKVNSKIINGAGADYSFTDYTVAKGINYYRLKMVDKDGKFAYSNVSAVNVTANTSTYLELNQVSIKSNQVQIKVNSDKMIQGNLLISDALGRSLINTKVSLTEGENDLTKNVVLPHGVFYLSIITSENKVVKGFINQ